MKPMELAWKPASNTSYKHIVILVLISNSKHMNIANISIQKQFYYLFERLSINIKVEILRQRKRYNKYNNRERGYIILEFGEIINYVRGILDLNLDWDMNLSSSPEKKEKPFREWKFCNQNWFYNMMVKQVIIKPLL